MENVKEWSQDIGVATLFLGFFYGLLVIGGTF